MSNGSNERPDEQLPGWGVYRGTTEKGAAGAVSLPLAPPWRRFPRDQPAGGGATAGSSDRGETYRADARTIEMVNAALYLRRPLLVTGKPGSGKSTLPYSVARELGLGRVLRWNVTSRTTLRDGLYRYDALARLHDFNLGHRRPVSDYIDLGPLGTALLPSPSPRVLLIDEIDKADIDLPNDLLNIFEEGSFDIVELAREAAEQPPAPLDRAPMVQVRSFEGQSVEVPSGRIHCQEFPFVVLTSNGEREFPAPFLRRCLRLDLPIPSPALLARIVDAHLPIDPNDERAAAWQVERDRLIANFVRRARRGDVATDQLLNALFMTIGQAAVFEPGAASEDERRRRLIDALLRHLTPVGAAESPTVGAADDTSPRND